MNNRLLTFLSVAMLLGIGILLAFNMSSIFGKPLPEKYIAYNDIRGMAIIHKNKPYTLNFDQQNAVVGHLNRALTIGTSPTPTNFDFSSIVIYRFNKDDIFLNPIALDNENNIIFNAPAWSPNGFIKDVSRGELKNLLNQTYGP